MNRNSFAFSLSIALGSALSFGCAASPGETDGTVVESEESLSVDVCPAGIPAALTPAADQTLDSKFTGLGVQIYMCNATPAGAYAWTFVAPQANLLTDSGRMIGTHFIGPTWQGNDGSSVVAKKAAGATVDAASLPWLLLTAVSHGTSAGRFSDITSIQRFSTVGGNAPTTGCDATTVGTIVQIPYSAEYVFYRTKTVGKVKQCAGI